MLKIFPPAWLTSILFLGNLSAEAGRTWLYNPLTLTANLLLDGYKKFISPLQGENVCQFSPTCSRYAREAINQQGFFLGLVMTADRLERCNPFAPIYAFDFYSGAKEGKVFDPPERHFLFKKSRVMEKRLPSIWRIEVDTFRFLFPGEQYDLAFADFLFAEGEFHLAGVEYLKAKFWTSDERVREYARVMIAESYSYLGNYSKARQEIEGIKEKELRMFCRGRLFLAEGKYDSARAQLYYIKDTLLKNTAQFLYGLSYLYSGDFDRALSHFKIKERESPQKRSPILSGFLSLLLPGAGQVYSGRLGDGLYSFLVVGTLGGITYYYGKEKEKAKFYLFLSLTSLFHLGNIYGAIIAASDYNQKEERSFISRVEERIAERDYKIDLKTYLLR